MAAILKWNGAKAKEAYRAEAAERLLGAATFLQQKLRAELNVAYPPASKPGEFPRRRTGNLREQILVVPDTAKGVLRAGLRAKLGYGKKARYGGTLENRLRRLGLRAILNKYRGALPAKVKTRVVQRGPT